MNWFQDLLANPALSKALPPAILETLLMVGISGAVTVLIGLPLGVLLHSTGPNGLRPVKAFNWLASDVVVNITRSIPFAILMVSLIPLARLLVGTSLGPLASTVSLSIGTIPFFARLVETSMRDVSTGKVDAAKVMGSTNMQIISKVYLPEALPGLVAALTTTVITLIGYSAMVGLVGGGGLGYLAYNYGYVRFDTPVMVMTIIIIVIMVQLVQVIGDRLSKAVDHR
jgi:D-methionine transport system permease protein